MASIPFIHSTTIVLSLTSYHKPRDVLRVGNTRMNTTVEKYGFTHLLVGGTDHNAASRQRLEMIQMEVHAMK